MRLLSVFLFVLITRTAVSQSFTDSLSLNNNRITDSTDAMHGFNDKFYDAVLKKRPLSVFLLGDSHVKQGSLGKNIEKTLNSFLTGEFQFPPKDSLDNTAISKIIEEYHEQLSQETEGRDLKLATARHATGRYAKNDLIFNQYGVIGASYFYYNYNGFAAAFAKNFRPDLYIISLGVNDCYYPSFDTSVFMTQVSKMVTSIKKESPGTQILIVLPPDHFTWKYRKAEVNNNILTLRAALIPWLKSNDIPWYDFFEVMGGSGSIKMWQRNKYAEGDLIHFTFSGYQLWGKLLGTALINNFLYSLIKDEVN